MPLNEQPADLPDDAALFLDLDGTLIDFAPTPDSVIVPPDLIPTLHRLRTRLHNALAIVSGRPIAQVDALLGTAPYAVAGEHGAAIRMAPDAPVSRPELPSVPPAYLAQAELMAAAHPGVLLERKAHSFVLHYRRAPEAGKDLKAGLEGLVGNDFKVMKAAMAWEVKPHGVDKATAVTVLMAHAPFVGRVPVYIGDDVTDEDGIRAAQGFGGRGWRVSEVFGDPAGVRAWLQARSREGISRRGC